MASNSKTKTSNSSGQINTSLGIISGTQGDDTIYLSDSKYKSYYGQVGTTPTIDGGNGKDIIFGTNRQESISGGSGSDWINGGGGNDTMDGGNGNDSMSGGDGDDYYYMDAANDLLPNPDAADSEPARRQMEKAAELLRLSQTQVRRTVWGLRSLALEKHSLAEALRDSVRLLTEDTGITTTLDLYDGDAGLAKR